MLYTEQSQIQGQPNDSAREYSHHHSSIIKALNKYLQYKCNVDQKQAGAELCQAQIKLEVIGDVVGEAWS